jgi:orotidine-5'-phosphate decarboxylase
MKDKIIVALDVQQRADFEKLIFQLKGHAHYVKVGMELYYSMGPSIIKILKEMGFKVFLDLKIHDIPNTAFHAAKSITHLGADMINVHASGGIEMMVAARLGMEAALKENAKLVRPKIIAVTQLTSTDQSILENDILIHKPLTDVVLHYATKAQDAKLDGVVSSALEVQAIKDKLGKDFLCVTPGIRLKDHAGHDQKRITTPEEAFALGSDYIVIGRAITQSENPGKTIDSIIQKLNGEKK